MPAKKNVKPKELPTKVVLVIDKSSSIRSYGLENDMINNVNALIDSLRGHVSELGIVEFASEVTKHPMRNIEHVAKYTNYSAYGNTSLFDGVGQSISMLGNDKNYNYLVMVLTDGEENWSRTYNKSSIKKLIEEKEATDCWTITFQVPKGKKQSFHNNFGIPLENITEWEQSSQDFERTTQVTTSALNNYFNAPTNARGARMSSQFYVDVNLQDLKTKDLKEQLIDLRNQFNEVYVDRNDTIKPFVERKTKQKYTKGSAYYMLKKPELVQKNKQILVREIGKSAIYGGNFSRSLIGLPNFGIGNSKVNPVNLAKYEIYVESTSYTRKLTKGTKLLIKV